MTLKTGPSHLCWHTTLDGTPCENPVADGSRYCWQHQGLPGAAAGHAGHELSLEELGEILGTDSVDLEEVFPLSSPEDLDAFIEEKRGPTEEERQHYGDVHLAAGGMIASDSRLESGTIEGGDRFFESGTIIGPADAVAFGYGKRISPFEDDASGGAAHYAEEDHWDKPNFGQDVDEFDSSGPWRKQRWTTRLKRRLGLTKAPDASYSSAAAHEDMVQAEPRLGACRAPFDLEGQHITCELKPGHGGSHVSPSDGVRWR